MAGCWVCSASSWASSCCRPGRAAGLRTPPRAAGLGCGCGAPGRRRCGLGGALRGAGPSRRRRAPLPQARAWRARTGHRLLMFRVHRLHQQRTGRGLRCAPQAPEPHRIRAPPAPGRSQARPSAPGAVSGPLRGAPERGWCAPAAAQCCRPGATRGASAFARSRSRAEATNGRNRSSSSHCAAVIRARSSISARLFAFCAARSTRSARPSSRSACPANCWRSGPRRSRPAPHPLGRCRATVPGRFSGISPHFRPRRHRLTATGHRTAPHRTAPHRTAPHRTAPHRDDHPLRHLGPDHRHHRPAAAA
ncbi:hypothetical protein ABIA33_006363 [Streptacidiphilus sp. MAP12-16]